MFRPAKHVHDIHPFIGSQNLRKVSEIGHSCLAEYRFRAGRDRDDSVAKPL